MTVSICCLACGFSESAQVASPLRTLGRKKRCRPLCPQRRIEMIVPEKWEAFCSTAWLPTDAIWGQAKTELKRKPSRIWFLITQTGSNMVTAQKERALFVPHAMIAIMIKLGNIIQSCCKPSLWRSMKAFEPWVTFYVMPSFLEDCLCFYVVWSLSINILVKI